MEIDVSVLLLLVLAGMHEGTKRGGSGVAVVRGDEGGERGIQEL